MKTCRSILMTVLLLAWAGVNAEPQSLKQYLSSFDYAARKEMKAGTEEALELIRAGKAQLVDIRFPEEQLAWQTGFARTIPLNELPSRLAELDRSKIIITACPHKDRAILAMVYLKTRGYRTKYLKDGLLDLVEYLRGDRARDFISDIKAPAGK